MEQDKKKKNDRTKSGRFMTHVIKGVPGKSKAVFGGKGVRASAVSQRISSRSLNPINRFRSWLQKPQVELVATQRHYDKLKATLPPLSPDSLDGTGKRDIALYTTTWNMAYCPTPTEDTVKYWLPKSYDVYVVALQVSKLP